MGEYGGIDGISVMYVSGIIDGRRGDLVKSLSSSGFRVEEGGDGHKSAEIYFGGTHIGAIVLSDSEGTGAGQIPEYFLCLDRLPSPNTGRRIGKYLVQ